MWLFVLKSFHNKQLDFWGHFIKKLSSKLLLGQQELTSYLHFKLENPQTRLLIYLSIY